MITYQTESWDHYYHDSISLWDEQYSEVGSNIGHVITEPNVPAYAESYKNGNLVITTARKDGKLIGYQLFMLCRHMHYDLFCAFEDCYYLSKSERRGATGLRLLREAEKNVLAKGVKKIFFMTQFGSSEGRLFEKMGYEKCNTLYSKWVGD